MLAAAAAVLGWPLAADAAWLGFRNDLGYAIQVQSCTQCKDGTRQGIPHKLHPGELAWDWVAVGSTRQIVVRDAANAANPLVRADITLGKQDVLYSIQRDGKSIHLRKTWEGSRQRSERSGK
jgi:hypothetical protein